MVSRSVVSWIYILSTPISLSDCGGCAGHRENDRQAARGSRAEGPGCGPRSHFIARNGHWFEAHRNAKLESGESGGEVKDFQRAIGCVDGEQHLPIRRSGDRPDVSAFKFDERRSRRSRSSRDGAGMEEASAEPRQDADGPESEEPA